MTISIVLDPYCIENGDEVLHIGGQEEYVRACRKIDEAINGDCSLTVAVHNRGMFTWLDQFRGRASVSIHMADPCRELAGALRVAEDQLPSEVRQDPSVVVAEGLLDTVRSTPPRPGQKPLAWILQATLGSVWKDDQFKEPSQVVGLLMDCVSDRRARGPHPAILALRSRRIQQWVAAGSPYADTIAWLFAGSPAKRAQSLMLRRLVQGYPHEVQVKALNSEGRWAELSMLANAQGVLDALSPDACLQARVPLNYSQVLRAYLESTLADSGMGEVLRAISGALPLEALVLEQYLTNHLREIDTAWAPLLSTLIDKFAEYPTQEPYVRFFRGLLPESRPAPLAVEANWNTVSSWLTREYFPFYCWCAAVRRIEETTALARQFEDWLIRNYDGVTRVHAYAPFALRDVVAEFLSSGAVLLVVVDGLPWFYAEALRRDLANRGIMCQRPSAHVCAIPSETAVSKPSLAAGKTYCQMRDGEVDEQQYADLLMANLGLSNGEVICGTSLTSGLQDLVRRSASLYLYLHNELDQQIHKVAAPRTRSKHVEGLLVQLASDIAEALADHTAIHGGTMSVVLCSDHGYTELPEGEVAVLPLPLEDGTRTSHGRVAYCGAGVEAAPAGMLLLGEGFSGSKEITWLVPRGYACVGAKPRGAVHGGLTPQEVVVPIIASSRERDLTYAGVEFGITGEIRRGRAMNPVRIVVSNPNKAPVVIQEIEASLVTVSEGLPLVCDAGKLAAIGANINGERLSADIVQVAARVVVDFLGEVRTTDHTVNVKTTGAALADRDFEAEFDV